MGELADRLRGMPCGDPNCTDGAIPHGPTPDGHWEAEQCQICYEIKEAADALEAKNAEVEQYRRELKIADDDSKDLEAKIERLRAEREHYRDKYHEAQLVIDAARKVRPPSHTNPTGEGFLDLRIALAQYDKEQP